MSQMFRAKCAQCQTIYDVCAIPMPVDKFVRLSTNSHCPLCGNARGNTCADARDLTESEITRLEGAKEPNAKEATA